MLCKRCLRKFIADRDTLRRHLQASHGVSSNHFDWRFVLRHMDFVRGEPPREKSSPKPKKALPPTPQTEPKILTDADGAPILKEVAKEQKAAPPPRRRIVRIAFTKASMRTASMSEPKEPSGKDETFVALNTLLHYVCLKCSATYGDLYSFRRHCISEHKEEPNGFDQRCFLVRKKSS